MSNPRTTAIISGIAVILLGYRIFFSSEDAGPTLGVIQGVFFVMALVGLIGSLVRIGRK